ncbi:MAG: hypothetical protein R3E95_12225 [Thiolinea sp.]
MSKRLATAAVWLAVGGLVAGLSACTPGPQNPVSVCKAVAATLLGSALPQTVDISEQEIHGERIVVHLGFTRSAQRKMTQVVCVYGADPYRSTEYLYSRVPTRLAIDGEQISEERLLAAIERL